MKYKILFTIVIVLILQFNLSAEVAIAIEPTLILNNKFDWQNSIGNINVGETVNIIESTDTYYLIQYKNITGNEIKIFESLVENDYSISNDPYIKFRIQFIKTYIYHNNKLLLKNKMKKYFQGEIQSATMNYLTDINNFNTMNTINIKLNTPVDILEQKRIKVQNVKEFWIKIKFNNKIIWINRKDIESDFFEHDDC